MNWSRDEELKAEAARGRVRRERAQAERLAGGGRVSISERRMRALMVVPRGTKLNSQQGSSMMLISATSVSSRELNAGVQALLAARDEGRSESGQLIAALAAMGFEFRREGV